MLSVILLSVTCEPYMLSVVRLNIVILSVVMLSVVAPLHFLKINATYSRSHDTNTTKISATDTGNGYVNATDICSTNIIITLVSHALVPMAIVPLALATKTLAPSFLVPLTLIPTTFVPMTIVRLQRSSTFIESFLALFCHLVLTRLRYPHAKMPNVVQPFAVWSNVGAPQSF
jgi:hypothetical protein